MKGCPPFGNYPATGLATIIELDDKLINAYGYFPFYDGPHY